MKSFILSIFMSLFPLFGFAQSYEKLWKQVEQEEADGKPQSAYATVQKILQKALAEGRQGQVLSARLRSAGLHQEWAPDSFFTDVAELEALRAQEQRPEARAIYASILAEVYAGNRSRSQAQGLTLTSEEMKEWTREQYDSAAVRNWQLSLENLEVLAAASSKDWLPFVAQASHSSYFRHDMLHILWQRFRDQRSSRWEASSDEQTTLGTAVRDLYSCRGNREAALLVDLDLVKNEVAPLEALRDQYASQPLCTEVYLRLLDTDAKDSQKVAWCKEAISRYPRYARIGEVRNRLNDLLRPQVTWRGNDVYYPGKHYAWLLTTKNASAVTMTVYRLTKTFTDDDLEKSKLSVEEYLRRNGQQLQKINHSIATSGASAFVSDTLDWTAPGVGLYAVLLSATTPEREAKQRAVTNQYHLFHVTTLKTLTRILPQDNLEIIVVDAETGQPVSGATVELYETQQRADQRTRRGAYQTDAEGRVQCSLHLEAKNRRNLSVRTFADADTYLPEETIWRNNVSFADNRESTLLHLYTDRAIYRPGQTVHVSGVVYTQKHWDANVVGGKDYELLLRDANWKEVNRQQVRTDSLGVLAADFVLPDGGLPGSYHIQTDGGSVTFRVEEYKRPTFEVKMDEAPALQWPQDSITLTGKALGYNGVPVRYARVTGNYQFTYPYWWFRYNNSPLQPIDTLSTDETGAFRVRVPLRDIPAENLRHGLVLRLDVEVLSAAGETREGTARVPLCTTPLRLNITMQEQQDRDRLVPPVFTLISSTGKPVQGDIVCSIYPTGSDEAVASDATPETLCAALRDLPSGDYELCAVAKAGADTASAKAAFYLFSMADQRLPRRAESWLYSPTDTFDLQHPARLQVGSSFENVALYYSLVGKEGVVKNELFRLSDELRIIEIPYLPEYGDGVTAHFAFVKGGKSYILRKSLKLAMPDKQLRWQWTSFRDRLHSGDQETWTLRLTAPDGTPVGANLMATLYDASLDQLKAHSWELLVNRLHRVRSLPWRSRDFFKNYSAQMQLYFPMKDYSAEALSFDAFDSQWLNGLFFRGNAYGIRRVGAMRLGATKGTELHEVAVYEHADAMPMMAKSTANTDEDLALNGRIGGLTLQDDHAEEEGANEGERIEAASAAVRTNFNETAFFMPRLHSDPATGEVTLSFTLPESLTTWQFLGVAHTADMMTTTLQAQTIARKELMARLYLPRFLRAGDQGSLRAVVQNLTDSPLAGQLRLEVFDPETEKVILKKQTAFETTAQGETVLAFDYTPTEDYPIVAVRLTAESAQFSDGEQHYLPILSAKEWITESVEIRADGAGTFTTDLSTLFNKDNASATQRRLTVEYTTHPIWNVVQALPALREPQHDDVLSISSVLYANILSAHIAATTPRLKTIIELWKKQGAAAQSPLASDEDLKQLILDETPWLREANSDSQRRAQLIDLFNENLLSSRIGSTLEKLCQRQESDGGFAWFPGMRSSELMTRLVCIGLTHLLALTDDFAQLPSETAEQLRDLLSRAVNYVAQENARLVQELKKAEAKGSTIQTGSLMHLDYIYITQRAGVELTKSQQADVRYLLDHLKGSVAGMSNQERAMASIVLNGAGRSKDARLYFDSMKEHLTTTAAHGTFFDYAGGSFTPTGHKVIVHTAAMEAVRELAADDRALNSGLRRWLLQQKRTQMWESSICTTNAIYALLYGEAAAADLQSTAKDRLTLNYGKKKTVVSASDGARSAAALGYLRETYTDGAAPKSITVERRSSSEAWGAVYAQYLTPVADATAHAAGLTIRREVSSTAPRLGDKFTTRYIITADRDYEYVCLRADRAAAAEPAEQLSGYRYQGGLGYYRAVRDAHTDYFFDRLPKGTYVLEETAFIDRTGRYTTGLATIRCLYAPEYGGNTPTIELNINQ